MDSEDEKIRKVLEYAAKRKARRNNLCISIQSPAAKKFPIKLFNLSKRFLILSTVLNLILKKLHYGKFSLIVNLIYYTKMKNK